MKSKLPVAFGRHNVVALLGQGGMAKVYLTVDLGPGGVNKLLVVKELRDEVASEKDANAMFLHEARIATRLNHPNVVQTYEVCDDGDSKYLTMEFLEGQPLSEILTHPRAGEIHEGLRLRVLVDTLAALHYAHELADFDGTPLGIVHRDVSPHNIFVTYDGQVKLVDFGIAKSTTASAMTRSGFFKGKARYAAPEQAVGARVDCRVDVFCVGIILWEMVTGRRMWGDLPDMAVLTELATSKIPRVLDAKPDLAPELAAICARALAVSPDLRYATADAFRADLERYLESRPRRGSQRDLGRLLAGMFAEKRASLHARVEAQIKLVRESGAGATSSGALPAAVDDAVESVPTRAPGVASGGLARSPSTASHAVFFSGETPRRTLAVWGVLLAAAGAIAGGIALRGSSDANRIAAAASAAPPPVASVRVRIVADPPDAQISLDGARLPTNPFDGPRVRDAFPHTITAEAPGHAPTATAVTFEHDVDVKLALTRRLEPEARPAPSASGKRGATPPPSRHTGLDEQNPYGR